MTGPSDGRQLILIGGFRIVSYGYPGSNKRKCKRVFRSGHWSYSTRIVAGDSVRNNFSEIYFLAIDREVLAEQQIERENVKRSGANGEKQIRGPVEARNFLAARKRGRDIPAIARVRVEIKM